MEDTALRLQQLHLQRMLEQHEMEKENPPPGGLEYDHVHTPDPDGVHWSSRGSGGMIGVRSKPSPPKKEKGKHSQLSKKASTLPGDQRTTVLLLLDDEKVKPLEVELVSKTYPKEHEAFTSAFLRHNEFARKIFTGGDRLLKWYFQEDHLTFPRLCLIYQNRCSQGRTNPWVSKLIRNGPSLRGPVVVVQQKKSPNAETVVFEQYRRDDRHMLPAAAAFLMMTPVSCGDIPTRSITSVPAIHQRNPMRASAPPLQGVSSGVGLGQGGRTGMMDDGVQPQHPYLSSSVFSPTASPYAMATFSSLPTSPSSSNPSSGSSSPSTTPPSSVPHSPRSSFSSTGFVSSSAMATRPGSASSHSASFPALPMLQQPEGTVNLSGSLPSLPPYTTPHFYSPPLTTATGGGAGGLHEPPGFDVGGGGLIERPTVGSSGSIPVTRSDEFSAFSSPAFPYSLWAAPSPSPTPVSAATPPVPHHPQPSSYSAEGILSLPGQHPVPPQHAQFPVLQPQPLPLSSTGVFAPTQQQQQQQYRPLAPQTASAAASRSAPRHFSWEGPAERPVRAITAPEVLRATYPAPDSAIPHAARRASSDAGATSPRDGVDEQVVGKLKKIRNSPGPATKAQVNRLIHAYEEYTRIRDALSAESGAKRRGLSPAAAAGGKSSPSVTRKTKLFCRTMIFDAKMARMSDKCEEDVQNERLVAKWEEVLRAEVRSMLAEGLVDQHLVDRILLACFARRRVQTARELVCEVAKLTPNAVSRDEWHQLADAYEAFSPWLAAFIRQLASDSSSAAERPPTEAETREPARVTLRIIRRYTLDLSRACHADAEDQTECDDGSEEEVFLTVAPLAATVGELKHKLWHEQSRLAQQSPQQHQQEGCLPLRPNDMGVLYRFVAMKRGTTAEVHLEDQDVLQDYLLPLSSQPAATASDDASDDFAPGAKDRQTRRGRELADGGRTPAPTYDIVIVEEPRLLAFAHFPDLARSLAELKGLIDREERDLWSDNHLGRRPGSGAASEALARRTRLIDYLCHHFEYLEELHRGAIRRARKDRALRRQRKDAENGYRDDHHQPTLFGRKEKRIEAEGREASLERMNGDDDENEAGRYAPETKYIVRFITGSEETLADPWKSQSPPHQQATVERCAIHLGSLTKEDEEPLYAVFTRNPAWPLRSHSRWIFRAWSDELALVELHGLGNATAIFAHRPSSSSSSSSMSRPVTVDLPLPAPARYCASVEDLYLVPGVKLYFSAEHLLANRTNSKRFDQCAYAKDELAFVADSTRRAGLDYALGRCLRTLQNDPSLAVPHSRADASGSFHLEFLAPLYIKPRRSPKPDLVVALERRYDGNGRLGCYVATTLLSPAEAYASARRVKKIRQAWLAAVHQRPTPGSAGHRQGDDVASAAAAAAVTRQGVAPARTDNSASASPSNGHISDFKKSYRPSNNIVSRHAVGSNEDRYQQGQPQRQRAAAACMAVMNGADDEDEDAGEFKFEAEIDKWVSETEGEEESEYHDEDTSSTAST